MASGPHISKKRAHNPGSNYHNPTSVLVATANDASPPGVQHLQLAEFCDPTYLAYISLLSSLIYGVNNIRIPTFLHIQRRAYLVYLWQLSVLVLLFSFFNKVNFINPWMLHYNILVHKKIKKFKVRTKKLNMWNYLSYISIIVSFTFALYFYYK